jgi:uncharacterized protein (DUF2267 family)
MSATGLDVFDKTLQTTHIWLNEITEAIGPDKQVAWHVLGAVLRTLRDRVPLQVAVHLGAELPLLVRGTYYDQWHALDQPERYRTLDEFLGRVAEQLRATRPIDPADATRAVFGVLNRHVPEGQLRKVREALPEDVRALWSEPAQGSNLSGAAEGPVTAQPEQVRNIRT